MVKKNIKNSGLPSSADISKFLENYTKIKLNKEDLNIKNFRERTMKNIYDIYTITEKITFAMNEICNNCTEIVLTCYKGHCIGGPLDEDIKDSNNNQNHQYYGYQHQFNKENRHLFS